MKFIKSLFQPRDNPEPFESLDGQVNIRLIKKRDLPALEWDGEFIHFRRNYADSYQRQRIGTTLMWVAELIGSGIIGQVFIQLTSHNPVLSDGISKAYLYSFRIKPAYRGLGLGTYILDFVENDLLRRNYRFLTLNVAKENERALKLYLERGFVVAGHEPGNWSYVDHLGQTQHVSEPAWRMEKQLGIKKTDHF